MSDEWPNAVTFLQDLPIAVYDDQPLLDTMWDMLRQQAEDFLAEQEVHFILTGEPRHDVIGFYTIVVDGDILIERPCAEQEAKYAKIRFTQTIGLAP